MKSVGSLMSYTPDGLIGSVSFEALSFYYMLEGENVVAKHGILNGCQRD